MHKPVCRRQHSSGVVHAWANSLRGNCAISRRGSSFGPNSRRYLDNWFDGIVTPTQRGSLDGLKVVSVGEATNLCHPWFVTADRLRAAPSDVLFLPCPPVTRGEEVSAEAMAYLGHQVYEAKAYLLHAQNAVLTTLI